MILTQRIIEVDYLAHDQSFRFGYLICKLEDGIVYVSSVLSVICLILLAIDRCQVIFLFRYLTSTPQFLINPLSSTHQFHTRTHVSQSIFQGILSLDREVDYAMKKRTMCLLGVMIIGLILLLIPDIQHKQIRVYGDRVMIGFCNLYVTLTFCINLIKKLSKEILKSSKVFNRNVAS